MKDNKTEISLLRNLLMPVFLATILAFILEYCCPWRGLWMSLGVTFIGILLTVFYVDRILKRHRESQWSRVKDKIDERVLQLASATVSSFRNAFEFDISIFGDFIPNSLDLVKIRSGMIEASEKYLIPNVKTKIHSFDSNEWSKYIKQLEIIWKGADRIVELFGPNLDPEILCSLFDIQEYSWSINSIYSTWIDFLGVPDSELPDSPNKDHAEQIVLRDSLNDIASNNSTIILEKAVNILRFLNKV